MWLMPQLVKLWNPATQGCRYKKVTRGAQTSSKKRNPSRIIKILRNHFKLKKHFDCKQMENERSYGKSITYNTSFLTVFPKKPPLANTRGKLLCLKDHQSLNQPWPLLFFCFVLINKHNNFCRLTCWKESSNKVCLDTLIFT